MSAATYAWTPDDVLRRLRDERVSVPECDRDLVARHVLAVVAMFARRDDVAEAAVLDRVEGDGAVHVLAEQLVRDLADEAQSQTLHITGRRCGDVLMEVLDREELADDYLRILADQQSFAFSG